MVVDNQIGISVLEGAFFSLREVGTPLPVCVHLQDKGARLESAQRTAKQTKLFFFSVLFLAGSRGSCGKVPKAPKVEEVQEEVCKG